MASRLRKIPVLGVSGLVLATLFLLLGCTGTGAAARNSIGLVLVGGMFIGMLFTLLVIPSIHMLIARDHGKDREREATIAATDVRWKRQRKRADDAGGESSLPPRPSRSCRLRVEFPNLFRREFVQLDDARFPGQKYRDGLLCLGLAPGLDDGIAGVVPGHAPPLVSVQDSLPLRQYLVKGA